MLEIVLDILVILGIVAVITDQLSKNKKSPGARPKDSGQAPLQLSKNKKSPGTRPKDSGQVHPESSGQVHPESSGQVHPEGSGQVHTQETQQGHPQESQLSSQKKQKRERSQCLSIEPLTADVEMLHPKN
ncbi:MAG: hypothetical protein F6J93_18075 [Oscillatoria sp. SIO1A7]|nr:hypothetical protein [Oscillatoria sp. SIO1A7]